MKKVTKRKVWKRVNTIAHVMEGLSPIPESRLDKLRQRELIAIDAFAKGGATVTEWDDIYTMALLSLTMAKGGVGPEALPSAEAAISALKEDMQRFERTGKMGTTAAGLQAFRDVYGYHDLQRQSITLREYERHIRATVNLVRSRPL